MARRTILTTAIYNHYNDKHHTLYINACRKLHWVRLQNGAKNNHPDLIQTQQRAAGTGESSKRIISGYHLLYYDKSICMTMTTGNHCNDEKFPCFWQSMTGQRYLNCYFSFVRRWHVMTMFWFLGGEWLGDIEQEGGRESSRRWWKGLHWWLKS